MIELAAVVQELRTELYKAIDAGDGERLSFELGPIELEVSVGLEQTDTAGGKIRFWVVDLNGSLSDKSITTQKLKLTLTPSLEVGGQRTTPHVSGRAERGEE
ncbi:trypco2 family protein [Actinoplanes sp. CA-142083]|uniref:trypco2 family protein n=1 Tax=Actinoplanes sp. CA-142083 TaxID=3239903 RepID=UPI003D90483E